MSETKMNDIKPFKQVPSCEANAVLSITGEEYDALQNVLNAFKAPILALESIFARNLNEGNIVVKYIQEDGTEVPQETALEYIEYMKSFLKSKEEATN